jgi:hypothetical protein
MHLFISWSGTKSRALGEYFLEFLPILLPQVKPWLSTHAIGTGTRPIQEIADSLSTANLGITCLTADNQHQPWIQYEAGAIAKLAMVGRAMIVRMDLNSADITGPLTQFQNVSMDEGGLRKLVNDLNQFGDPAIDQANLTRSFTSLWEQEMKGRLAEVAAVSDGAIAPPRRKVEDMLEEVLDLVRKQDSDFAPIAARIRDLHVRAEYGGGVRSLSPLTNDLIAKEVPGLHWIFQEVDAARANLERDIADYGSKQSSQLKEQIDAAFQDRLKIAQEKNALAQRARKKDKRTTRT